MTDTSTEPRGHKKSCAITLEEAVQIIPFGLLTFGCEPNINGHEQKTLRNQSFLDIDCNFSCQCCQSR